MEQLAVLCDIGGTLRLTADIEIPPDTEEWYSGNQGSPMITLDVGEHTIYVGGTLKLCPYLTISGKGGENGLLQVRNGGELHLYGVSLCAQEGYAVYQQDGGLLYHGNDIFSWGVDFSCEGEIRYGIPIAMSASSVNQRKCLTVIVVQNGQDPLKLLPETDKATLCKNGKETYDVDLPVVWNVDSAAGSFERRERVLLVGEYSGEIYAMSQPLCLVVFRDDRPATMLQCWGKPGNEELAQPPLMDIYFKLENPEASYRLDWSPDGEIWQAVPDGDYIAEEGRIWYRDRIDGVELPFYVCVAVIGTDGSESYSDVVRVTGEDYPGDSGGNRGGGTDLGQPELPDNGTDNGGDDKGPDTSPGEPEPPGNDTGSGNSNDADTPPDNSAPSGDNSMQDIAQPAPPVSERLEEAAVPESSDSGTMNQSGALSRVPSDKQIISGEPEKAEASDAAPPPAKDEAEPAVSAAAVPEYRILQSEEKIRPAQAPPASSARVLAQMISGIAVTGGIVVLTVTWSPKAGWGKRLLRMLSVLFKR